MSGDYIEVATRQRAAAIEEACEAALQDGRYGVLVWGWTDRDFTMHTVAQVDSRVPYGEIHERPWGERPLD